MKHIRNSFFFLFLTLMLILSACGGKPTATQSAPNLAYTQIWETVAAGQTQTAGAAPLTTDTPQVSPTPKSTNTPLMSPTSAGSTPDFTAAAPAATNTRPRSTAQASCDNFQFVSDVSIPDGSEIEAGTSFVKTWRIKNLGPCEWNQDYMITFGWGGEGTDWKTADPMAFSKAVKVGDTIDLSMELVAPDEKGDYGAVFRVKNPDDVYFGPTLTIYIVVP